MSVLSIVFSLRNSSAATSLLERPRTTSWVTSRSRAESSACPSAAASGARDAGAEPAQLACGLGDQRVRLAGARVVGHLAQRGLRALAVAGGGQRAAGEQPRDGFVAARAGALGGGDRTERTGRRLRGVTAREQDLGAGAGGAHGARGKLPRRGELGGAARPTLRVRAAPERQRAADEHERQPRRERHVGPLEPRPDERDELVDRALGIALGV